MRLKPRKKLRRQVRCPLGTGKRISVSANSEPELEQRIRKIQDIRSDRKAGLLTVEDAQRRMMPQVGKGITLRQLWSRFEPLISGRSRRAAKSAWEFQLERQLGDLAVFELTNARITRWEAELLAPAEGRPAGYAPKTVQVAWWLLQKIIKTCALGTIIERLPWGDDYRSASAKAVRLARDNGGARRPREALTSIADMLRVFHTAKQKDALGKGDLFVKIAVLLLAGLRQAEAAGLGWDKVIIDNASPCLRIDYQAPNKWHEDLPGDRPRIPPKNGVRTHVLHPSLVEVLQNHREQQIAAGLYRGEGPVFPEEPGRPHVNGWRMNGVVVKPARFKRIVKKAGIPGENWTTHSLRHSQATLELEASGGDLKRVQERTGHKSTEVLVGYIKQFGGRLGQSSIPQLPEGTSALPARALLPPRTQVITREEARDESALKRLAKTWAESGLTVVPKQITEEARAAYSRAYSRELKRTGSKEKAQRAGANAAKGIKGVWKKIYNQAERDFIKAAKKKPQSAQHASD